MRADNVVSLNLESALVFASRAVPFWCREHLRQCGLARVFLLSVKRHAGGG